jgi:hypothetical protein
MGLLRQLIATEAPAELAFTEHKISEEKQALPLLLTTTTNYYYY